MIKINLANKKRAAGTGTQAGNDSPRRAALNAGESLGMLKNPKFRQLILLFAGLAGVYYTLESYKADELQKADAAVQVATQKSAQLRAEVAKTSGFEEMKRSLDADELAIRTKIETIQKLVAERPVLPKAMQSVATIIPSDVWLSEFKANADDFTFTGYSMGYGQISDFMKSLGDSAYFTDLRMVASQMGRDDTGNEVAQFELGAKRRQ